MENFEIPQSEVERANKMIAHLQSGKVCISESPNGERLAMVDLDSERLYAFVRQAEYRFQPTPKTRKAVETIFGIAACIYFSNGRIWDATYGFRKQGWKEQKEDYV